MQIMFLAAGEATGLTPDEQSAVTCFKDTTYRDQDGRYYVELPKRDPQPELGESKTAAVRRFKQNQRSLQKKNQWKAFLQGLQEYVDLNHAEPIPSPDIVPFSKEFYLPTHVVAKESSTTTKLRIVFDGSATTLSGSSFNDALLPGPSLYPLLTTILNKFRLHHIRMSPDISKMFREVGLAP